MMMAKNDRQPSTDEPSGGPADANQRPPYEPPRIDKKRLVSQVTLFSGGGPSAGGVPAGGVTASG
jgi:hypothetical protein